MWENNEKPTPTVYYAVGHNPKKVDAYAVQYWFFYFYNDWVNNHAGDWESVTIFFDRYKDPTEMCYSTHHEARRHLYRLVEKEKNGHPHVFVSNGGHGSYATEGDTEYLGSADNHYGNKQVIGPADDDHVYDDYVPTYKLEKIDSQESGWGNFAGKWGNNDSAPQGPKFRTDAPSDELWLIAKNEPRFPDSCDGRLHMRIFSAWAWADGYPLEVPVGDLNTTVDCLVRPELLGASKLSPILTSLKWNKRGAPANRYYLKVFNDAGENIEVEEDPLDSSFLDSNCTGERCEYYIDSLPGGKYSWALRASNTVTRSAWTDLQEFEIVGQNSNVSLVFVLDESGSIDHSDWILEQEGFREALVRLPQDAGIDISVIKFSSDVTVLADMTFLSPNNFPSLDAVFNSYQSGDTTAMDMAIDEAVRVLEGSNASTKFIFLATDGEPDVESATEASAAEAKLKGIVLEPIGIGLESEGYSFLNSISSNQPVANPANFKEFATVIVNKVLGSHETSINLRFSKDIVDFGMFPPEFFDDTTGVKQKINILNDSTEDVIITGMKISGQDNDLFSIENVDGKEWPINYSLILRPKMNVPVEIGLLPSNNSTNEGEKKAILTVFGRKSDSSSAEYSSILRATIDPNVSFAFQPLDIIDAQSVIAEITDDGQPLTHEGNPATELDVALAIQDDTAGEFTRSGIAADGNARLLIRSLTSEASGIIRFKIPANAETESFLYPLDFTTNDDMDGYAVLDVPIATNPDGNGQATAILRAGE